MARSGMSIQHILCPTDFSEFAESAYRESVRLARWLGASLTVVHVTPRDVLMAGDLVSLPPPPAASEALRRARLLELRRFVDAVDHEGIEVQTSLRFGEPAREIRHAIRDSVAHLVVMGTHGRSGLAGLFAGSVTEALMRHAPVPVLAVHAAYRPRTGLYQKILCATDVSEWSERTIGFAIDLAGDGAEHLTVLSVIEDLPEIRARALGRFGVREVEDFRENLLRETTAELQHRIPDEARVSCRIEEHVRFGQAYREILQVAEEEAADLIVMGSHGRGALDRLVFGSTVRHVVRGAPCPVVVVPSMHAWPATSLVAAHSTEA